MGRMATRSGSQAGPERNSVRPAMGGPAAAHPALPDDPWGWLIWGALGLHVVVLLSIVLAMTPFTHNLDDIKIKLFFMLGPLLTIAGLALMALRVVPAPPRFVLIGLGGYLAVVLISALASEFRWMGNFYIRFYWIAGGFFLSAMAIASRRRSMEWFLRYMVVQLLATNLIGLFMFNITYGGSGVAWLHEVIYDGRAPAIVGGTYRLLMTLVGAQSDMQSTILSRDFYAAFCVLYLPLALLLALDPGKSRLPWAWQLVGLVTALLTLICIFYCQSKGEYLFAVAEVAFFAGMFFFVGKVSTLNRRHLAAWIIGVTIFLGTIVWLRSPTIMGHLKGIHHSFESREIIWGGSWGIFKDHPVIGGGPGTFRIFFPDHRRPDYMEHEISNVTLYSHNIFLDLLAETGVFGFVFFIILLCALWFGAFRLALTHPDRRLRNLFIALMASMIGIYGSNLSSPNGRWVIGATSLWTVMGFMAGVLLLARGKGPEPESALDGQPAGHGTEITRWTAGGLGLVGILMLFWSFPLGRNYFDGAKEYVEGLSYMQPAFDMIEQPGASTEQIHGLLDRSAPYFERAISKDPSNISAYYKLGSVYTTMFSIYDQYAREMEQQNRPEAAQMRQQSNLYLELAKKRYEALAEYWPDYAEIHYNLGLVYKFWSSYLAAQSQAQATAEGRATYLAEANKYQEMAREHLDEMARMSIKSDVAINRGEQYESMGLMKEAQEIYAEAAKRYPKEQAIAARYYRAASAAGAARAMAEALELLWLQDPNDSETLSMLLRQALDAGHDELLERTVRHLERMNPVDPRLYEVRMMLADRRTNPGEKVNAAIGYLRVGGMMPEFMEMGWRAAVELGREDEASTLAARFTELTGAAPDQATTLTEALAPDALTTGTGQ